MSVFRNYNSQKAGNVNANAFPRVHPIPWVPTQRNVRTNPNIPSQPQRIQPNERGTFYPTSASNGGTLAPQMSSAGCGCGGGCSGVADSNIPPTASDIATSHSFPVVQSVGVGTSHKSTAPPVPRVQPRTTGAIRGTARVGTIRQSVSKMQLAPGGIGMGQRRSGL